MRRSTIESLGVYLPPKEVSTHDIVKGCARKLLLPLERLTGIQSRRMAGEDEFSYDLAVKAMEDCFAHSKYGPSDIDMLVSGNISRFDGPDEYSFEPGTAVKLSAAFGMRDLLTFDVTNACAGMFTGVYLVDALVRAGAIRRGMVVSGEYITHLALTAQKEIQGLADPRVPCLTLGDAGAAVIVDAATDAEHGFDGIGLYTMGAHSSLCIAKVTDQPHGGAIMTTEMIKLAQISITAFLQYAAYMAMQLRWSPDMIDHLLPHQTSRTSLSAGSREVKKIVAGRVPYEDKVVDNVAHRGNTATTSHFVALKDCFLNGKIKSGESVLFGILASGITVGAALHRFDDLPDRIRRASAGPARAPAPRPAPAGGAFLRPDRRPRVRVEAVGVVEDKPGTATETVPMLTAAAESCLSRSAHGRGDIDVLLSTGVYRTDFLTEPAIAALLAGALRMNDAPRTPMEKKTLAFDVVNGGLGTLYACLLAAEMVRGGQARTVMIAASEVENNAASLPDCLRGIRATASAMILDATASGDSGFGAFAFRTFPEYARDLRSYGRCHALRIADRDVARLFVERDPQWDAHVQECIAVTVRQLLEAAGIGERDIRVVLSPQISTRFIRGLAERLAVTPDRFVDVAGEGGDLFTSGLAYGFAHWRDVGAVRAGDLGLVIGVASGIQVGCAVYHF